MVLESTDMYSHCAVEVPLVAVHTGCVWQGVAHSFAGEVSLDHTPLCLVEYRFAAFRTGADDGGQQQQEGLAMFNWQCVRLDTYRRSVKYFASASAAREVGALRLASRRDCRRVSDRTEQSRGPIFWDREVVAEEGPV